LFNVTLCAAGGAYVLVANVTLDAPSVTAGRPVPLNAIVCAIRGVICDRYGRAPLPVAEGVKVTEMLQLPPAATLAPQVLFCANPGATPVPKYS
jgi:hypothetical protein